MKKQSKLNVMVTTKLKGMVSTLHNILRYLLKLPTRLSFLLISTLLVFSTTKGLAQNTVPLCASSYTLYNVGPSANTNPGPYTWTYPPELTFSCNPCQVVAYIQASAPGTYPVSVSFTGGTINYSLTFGSPDADGDGVIACYDCNDNDPTIYPGAPEICDNVDNDCDGLLNEAPAMAPPAPPITTSNALNFDGINDYVEISNCSAPAPLVNGGNAITIEYWFKGSLNHSAVRIQEGSNYVIAGYNGGHVLSNDGGTNGIPAGANVTDGNWHHVAMTWQRNTTNGFKSYLDGQLVAQQNSSNNPLPVINSGMFLGSVNGTAEFMNGSLDEVRIWNVARTQTEIQAGMLGSIAAPQSGLQVYYKFDHGIVNGNNAGINTLANSAGSAYSGVLYNFALNGNTSNWTAPLSLGPIRYVKEGGTGNGTSWANASGNLQTMIDAGGVEQVWVAAGTYKPTTGTDRNISFSMKNGVAILGGFPNTGDPELSDRNWTANVTTLSADIGVLGNTSDNSYHVIYNGNGTDNTASLNGFVLTGGNANGSSFTTLNGGAMFNYGENGYCNPVIVNCVFSNNSAYFGGAVTNNGDMGTCNPTFTNCLFFGNTANGIATNSNGGAMSCFGNTTTTLNNCTFSNNMAVGNGGAIHGGANFGNPTIYLNNCILWGNSGANDDQIYIFGTTLNLSHTTLQGGIPAIAISTFNNSTINDNGGNLSSDPLFVDAATNNFRLQACSPAANSGNNAAVPATVTTDLDGNPRFFNGGTVDMGAYEYQSTSGSTWYADVDGDGYGNPNVSQQACTQPMGYVADNTDCDDGNIALNPTTVWYLDADNDNYYTGGGLTQCTSPGAGYRYTGLAGGGDCDDGNPTLNPTTVWYLDADNDDYYTGGGLTQCSSPGVGYRYTGLTGGGDCDDGNPALNPTTIWYLDADSDDYYTGGGLTQCTSPGVGYRYTGLTGGGDCDDGNPALNPTTVWYLDADNDNYYTGGAVTQCSSPGTGYRYSGLEGGDDCNDGDPSIHPGAAEVCDNIDNNCNNAIDDGINCCPEGTIIYVNDDAAGNNDGSSWTDAYTDLQDALALAGTCTNFNQIWVAEGTYKPTSSTDRNISFALKNGLAILGGFPNTSNPGLSDRDWNVNVTTLSGDIGTMGDNSDNSYHIIRNFATNLNNSAVLDGFTISGGNANGPQFGDKLGGGMYIYNDYPIVANCTFSDNFAFQGGGGLFMESAPMRITNCAFIDNSTGGNGGGIYNANSGFSTLVANCRFIGNSAYSGGGMSYVSADSPRATNCLFMGNSASEGGGMSFIGGSSPRVTNSTFSGNSAGTGGGIHNSSDANPTLSNCILWGNGSEIHNSFYTVTVTYSIVQGGYDGVDNLDTAPLFVSTSDLHLQECSPAINTGDNASVPSGVTTDLEGNPRFFNSGTVDMGAYEFQSTPTPIMAICQNQTVNLDAGGSASIAVSALDGGSTGCGTLDFDVDMATTLNFSCAEIGTNMFTLTVADELGNTATCSTTITVEDNVAPMAICQNVTVQLDANGSATLAISEVNNGSSDVCGIATTALSQTTFDCNDVGANTETLTVTDANGNTATCSTTITVEDKVVPMAICQNVTVQLDANGSAMLAISQVNNGSSDDCGIATTALSQTTFDCNDVGENTETLTVTDANGNTATCSTTITVEDKIAPMAICQNVTVQLDANGSATLAISEVNNGSSDVCGIASTALSQTTFDCNDVGENTETLTVTDLNGNTAACSATITVEDKVVPMAVCQNVTVQLDANGSATLAISQVNNGSSDVCGIATTALSQTTFDCNDVGANTETLTVTDVNGNTATCSTTITVEDNVVPMAICQNVTVHLDANGSATLAISQVNNGSSDVCGIASTALSQTTFDCNDVGENTETLTVTDVNGNTATCSATITVEDKVAPMANCLNSTIIFNGQSAVPLMIDQLVDEMSFSDNCSAIAVTEPVDELSVGCEEVGEVIPITVSIEDASGNTASCTAYITVEGLPCGWQDQGGLGCNSTSNSSDFQNGSFSLTANDCAPVHPYVNESTALVFTEMCGDGEITALVTNVNGTGYAGVMMRDDLSPNAPMVSIGTNRVNRIRKQVRVLSGYPAYPQQLLSYDKFWVRLVRSGNQFFGYASTDGSNWFPYINQQIVMNNNCIRVGLFVYSEKSGTPASASFSNVYVTGQTTAFAQLPGSVIQSQESENNLDIDVFPNPTQEVLHIDLSSFPGQPAEVQFFNSIGEAVRYEQFYESPEVQQLDVSALVPGIYYLAVQIDNRRITKRVVIARK